MPEKDPPLPFIEQAFTCLDAYREDAHLAAWRESNLSATTFEALTVLWYGEASSLNGIVRKLARRGHDPKIYSVALSDLRHNGYIAGARTAIRLTPAGQEFRDQVEAETNELFFQAWKVLSEVEKVELTDLITRLRDGLERSA
jgi:DNA-binding MarR family transcriptional regulator